MNRAEPTRQKLLGSEEPCLSSDARSLKGRKEENDASLLSQMHTRTAADRRTDRWTGGGEDADAFGCRQKCRNVEHFMLFSHQTGTCWPFNWATKPKVRCVLSDKDKTCNLA